MNFIRLFFFLSLSFICANYADASPSPLKEKSIKSNSIKDVSLLVDHHAVKSVELLISLDTSALDQQSDSEEPLFPPRIIRANATEFNALAQLNPNYYLEIEFFSASLSAALYKNLVNPPLLSPWFMQISIAGTKQRLAGWKESNSLYTARNTYHS